MELKIDVKKLEKSRLPLQEFVYLQVLVEEIEYDFQWDDLLHHHFQMLERLQEDMYIKIIQGVVYPRQKAIDLFNIVDKDITFEEFWDKYHNTTEKPKTDKVPAEKHWNRLSKTKKRRAYDMIVPYFNSLDNPKYCKKARTYLADRNFEDEFVKETNEDPFTIKA